MLALAKILNLINYTATTEDNNNLIFFIACMFITQHKMIIKGIFRNLSSHFEKRQQNHE